MCGRSVAGIADSHPAGGMNVFVVWCAVKTTGQSQGSEDKETSTEKEQEKDFRKHKKENLLGGVDVCLLCVLCVV